MKKIVIGFLIVLSISVIVLFISYIDTTEASTKTLAQTVIDLSKGTDYTAGNGNGVYYTNSHEYRYVGGEVNNYVSFNDDLYRIIGVFDSNSTGVSGNLVKLIRARKLTAVCWGVYNKTVTTTYDTYDNCNNNWTGLDSNGTTTNGIGVPASANVILNEYFYNASSTSATYGDCINWTYGESVDLRKSKNCSNIVGYGIQTETLRNYIQPVTWYLYGFGNEVLNKANWYLCERNGYSGCTSAKSGAYQGTTIAPIGLMYVSDYMYASGYIASSDTSTTGSSSNFMNLNWLYNGSEWTITPYSGDIGRCFVIMASVAPRGTAGGYGLRPTFYLKSSVYVTGGDGSFHNPYTIACDNCNS